MARRDNGAGVVYANLSGDTDSHHVNIATTWPQTGYTFWEPNVSTTTVPDNQWFRLDWYVKWASSPTANDGIIRWWVNGVLNGNYIAMPFPPIPGSVQFEYASTRYYAPPSEEYMYIDHTHISTP